MIDTQLKKMPVCLCYRVISKQIDNVIFPMLCDGKYITMCTHCYYELWNWLASVSISLDLLFHFWFDKSETPVGKLGNLWTLFSHFCPSLWESLFYIESWHLAEVERGERRKDNYMKLYFIFWGVQRYYEGVILYKGWRMIPTFQSSNNLRKHWKTRRSNKLCNNTKSGHWYTLLGWHLHNTNKF